MAQFAENSRRFFYTVALLGHCCPGCQSSLIMIRDGLSCCESCKSELDPTLTFQRCPACGNKPALSKRRYKCGKCGQAIASRFLFDGIVFDRDYFCRKMREHRNRRKELKERVRRMLAEVRSPHIEIPNTDLTQIPGLTKALNDLTSATYGPFVMPARGEFDMNRYQNHIQAEIGPFPVQLRDIPPLNKNCRLDLIRRFVTIIFMVHDSLIDIRQEGRSIWVSKHETD